MSIDSRVLTDWPAQSLDTLATEIRDGDLLLCSADDPFSRLISWSTKSPWTHVAFAWRWPETGRILAFECVQNLGVRTIGMERFISETSNGTHPYPGKIVLARHAALAGIPDPKPLVDEGVNLIGCRFSSAEIVKIGMRIAFGRTGRETPTPLRAKDEFICSEYVDRCYRRVGVKIEWDGLGFIAPSDIADDPRVSAVARIQTR